MQSPSIALLDSQAEWSTAELKPCRLTSVFPVVCCGNWAGGPGRGPENCFLPCEPRELLWTAAQADNSSHLGGIEKRRRKETQINQSQTRPSVRAARSRIVLKRVSRVTRREALQMEFRNNSPERSQSKMPSSPRKTDGSVLVRLKDLERRSGRGVGEGLWKQPPCRQGAAKTTSGEVAWVIGGQVGVIVP